MTMKCTECSYHQERVGMVAPHVSGQVDICGLTGSHLHNLDGCVSGRRTLRSRLNEFFHGPKNQTAYIDGKKVDVSDSMNPYR